MQKKQILNLIPSALVSRAFGYISEIEMYPPLQRFINSGFVHLMGVNASESVEPVESYKSLNALFTRELRPGVRPISSEQVISPVDGKLSFMGPVSDGSVLEAKGRTYEVLDLTAASYGADWLRSAYAFTIYLSPKDYHRIHAPMTGQVKAMSYAPGRLLPVNRLGYMMADDLLPANERLTSYIEDEAGHRSALVKVGATCVGRISVVYDNFRTNVQRIREPFFKMLEKPWAVESGAPLGCFELGSTVVLLVDGKNFVPVPELRCGQAIKLGMPLGHWTCRDADNS